MPEKDDLVSPDQKWEERRLALRKRASLRLVVMIAGQLGDAPTLGAGIVFARTRDKLFAVTANHVIRRGPLLARDIKVNLKDYPDLSFSAAAAPHFDAELDVAVIEIDLAKARRVDPCALLMFPLGDERELKRGSAVATAGNPQGVPWGMSVIPEAVASVSAGDITFQSTFLSPGDSGGALLDGSGLMVGMIQRDQPPYGIAKRLSVILPKLRSWGYVVELYQPRQLERGGDESFSVLEEAVATGDVPLVTSLLNACPDVNTIDLQGDTPLHLAAMTGQLAVLKELIQRGANVNARKVIYPNVELLGGDDRYANVIGAGDSVLEMAVLGGNAEVVRVLLEAGADATGRDGRMGPLHLAAQKGYAEIVRLLARNAALLELGASGENGRTPLHVAVENSQLAAAKALLEMKASPNARDGSRRTPLHYAVSNCSPEMVRLLLDAGADTTAADESGATPLALATRIGPRCKDVRALLKARGAK